LLSPFPEADRKFILALLVGSFIWGLAEATLFFIVPDVIISLCALAYGWRAGSFAIAASLIGATIGGIATYFWGYFDIEGARAMFDQLPAIAPSTIARAQTEIAEGYYALSMLIGAVTSVPFKLYASEAGASGQSLATFIALSPVVRFPRFAFAALLALGARQILGQVLLRLRILGFVGFWVVFYAFYWTFAPN
jgi:membrane protein YqaA with SNARE-associated domain